MRGWILCRAALPCHARPIWCILPWWVGLRWLQMAVQQVSSHSDNQTSWACVALGILNKLLWMLAQDGRSSNQRLENAGTKYHFLLFGWLGVSAYKGCGWLVILILFMACDICHRPIPTLCVWFEPSFNDCRRIQESCIPPNSCSRLKTRKSFIFVWSWAGQHHPTWIQVHWGERGLSAIFLCSSAPAAGKTTQKGRRTLNPGCGGVVGG